MAKHIKRKPKKKKTDLQEIKGFSEKSIKKLYPDL